MKKKFYTAIAIIAFIGLSNASFAQTHQRETQVNNRIGIQTNRIDKQEGRGEITPREAEPLHQSDRHIGREENRMEFRHDGHITRHEERQLNHQEDRVNRHLRFR